MTQTSRTSARANILLSLGFLFVCVLASGAQAQLDVNQVLQQVSPQDTLGEICKDDKLKIVVKSICEPGGQFNQAVQSATPARLPERKLTLESAMKSKGDLSSSPADVKVRLEGKSCFVNTRNLALVKTDEMHLQSARGQLAGEKNSFVQSRLDEISVDVAQFIISLQTEQRSEEERGENFDNEGSYTVFSMSHRICEQGLQCVVREKDVKKAQRGAKNVNLSRSLNVSLAGDEVESFFKDDADGLVEGSVIQGTCQKCKVGSYCPSGVVNDQSGLLRFSSGVTNLCPQGYFCENPSTIKNCPKGLFCTAGSAKPFDCNDLGFDFKYSGEYISANLEGNYCGPNSVQPWGLCPGGYYCPNASVALGCQKGFYCPPSSTEMRSCPLLSHCPANAVAPTTSWLALVGILAVCLFVYGVSFLILRLNKASANLEEEGHAYPEGPEELTSPGGIVKLGGGGTLSHAVSDPLRVDIRGLTVNFGKKRTILHQVDLSIPSGTLNAIFGPSGSGKTTLIKSTLGKIAFNLNIKGSVSFTKCVSKEETVVYSSAGRSMLGKVRDFLETSRARKKVIQSNVGYVPQDNVVYENLTVIENILFSVKLRGKGTGKDDGSASSLADQIVNLLGLSLVRNTVVGNPEKGGISGGECRRVSIGLELAGCPPMLILDEPTTGLDAVSADRVMRCLNYLCRKSEMTIIASIHQPKSSIFDLFDNVHVLMKGGHVVFSGRKNAVLPYFNSIGFPIPKLENPADFMIDVISGLVNCKQNQAFVAEDLVGMWLEEKDKYSEGSLKRADDDEQQPGLRSTPASTSPFRIFFVLYKKDVLGWVRSLPLKTVDILTTAIFAVILAFNQGAGVKAFDDVLYMSMLTNLYMGMLSVVWAITLTLHRLGSAEREAGASISTALIFTAADVSHFADHLIRPTVYSILYYFIALPRMSFWEFYVVVTGVALSCSGLGELIAVILPQNLATVGGIIISFAFGGLLNGFSPPIPDLPSEWIVFPSYARWGIEALSLAEYRQYNDWKTQTGMNNMSYKFSNWKWALAFLFGSAFVFRLISFPFFRKRALN